MYNAKRFLHRIQEAFVIVGRDDYDELQDVGVQHTRFLELSMDALHCLRFFPNVEYLILTSGEVSGDGLQKLDGLKIKALKLDYYTYEVDAYTVDLSCFPLLELVFARTENCFKNTSQCCNLQTLIVQEWLSDSLRPLAESSIKALKIFSGKLKCVDGVGEMPQLVSLSIANQRQWSDCSGLDATFLESLEIVSCNKVDIVQLPVLQNVRMMHLRGKRKIPAIETLLHIAPELEWLLLDHTVEDGNLAPLSDLSHAVIFTDCRHYSHKNCNLPKATEKYCSRFLPFELEILPEAY